MLKDQMYLICPLHIAKRPDNRKIPEKRMHNTLDPFRLLDDILLKFYLALT
jgi:hypothetical protein